MGTRSAMVGDWLKLCEFLVPVQIAAPYLSRIMLAIRARRPTNTALKGW